MDLFRNIAAILVGIWLIGIPVAWLLLRDQFTRSSQRFVAAVIWPILAVALFGIWLRETGE